MTESLITDLAKIGALKVISRSSSMRYRGTDKSLAEIALELGVEALVEGSVLREGDRVRITAQLIEAASGRNLWAERYEQNLTSILALQGEVAQAIAREIRVTLSPQEESLLAERREVHPEAYEAYLKGMSHWYKLTPGDLETAQAYFETALEKDPEYAEALVGIAGVWMGQRQFGLARPRDVNPKIRETINRALEMDDTIATTHYALAANETWGEWNWTEAEAAFRKTFELDPNYAIAHAYYGHFLMIMRRPDEAMAHMKLALELDPLNGLFQWLNLVVLLNGAHRYDEVIEQSRQILSVVPTHPQAHAALVEAYYAKGMFEESYQAARDNWTARARPDAVAALERGYGEGGFQGAMGALAQWKVQARGPCVEGAVFNYAAAGKYQEALDILECGFEELDPMLPYLGVSVKFAALHKEPRFQEMLRQLNFPEDVLARYLDEIQ